MRRDLRDVSGQFVGAGGVAVARGNDGDLVHLAERLAESAHYFRQSGDEFVEHGGLVVFLEGLRLDVHGLGFGFALLEDDLGFGFALRANGGGAAFGFGYRALTLGAGKRFDPLPLDFRLFQYRSDELAFAARDFRFLYFHLSLALHLLHPHRFGDDLLLHDVGLDFVGFVGCGLRLLRHLQIAGLLDVEVAVGFGGGHFRVSLDARDVRPPHVGDVLVLVAYFLDGEADDFQPHLAHVVGARGSHAVANHFRFLDDLFHCELPDDSPEMPFHHQANQGFALFWPLRKKLLGSCQDGLLVVFHLDLRNGFDGYGDALLRV